MDEDNVIASNESKDHKRSASYPILSLEEAITYSKKVYDAFGSGIWFKRDALAAVLGVHVNTVSRDIAACSQFGFFDKSTVNGYMVTKGLTDLLNPETEQERKKLVVEAFGKPKLFSELIIKFDSLVLPEGLANTLSRSHNIITNVAPTAAKVFIDSARFAGVLTDGNGLKYKATLSNLQKTQYAEIITEDKSNEIEHNNTTSFVPVPLSADATLIGTIDIPIYLTGDKVAHFRYPKSVTEDDVSLLKHNIDGILLRIQLNNKAQKTTNDFVE